MGGYYCNMKVDGEKRLCLDAEVLPMKNNCLVYSFGVGHDLTFDIDLEEFGCDVYAFDSDHSHANYPTFISDRLAFYKARIGTHFLREFQYRQENLPTGPFMVEYWPLSGLMKRLGHQGTQMFYLKMDIEGIEWDVFEKSIFKTDILEGTVQLSLEIHFDELRQNGSSKNTQELLDSVNKYLRVIRGLQTRGFQLAHWEPNYKGPELTSVAGLRFHVYSETFWVNLNYQRRKNEPRKTRRPKKLS
ncbi:hypothetical protein SK128_004799 [Halocaridina rubra]|uniref:Methyltransferase domain-containing protein n=1 Tax=Halocaridina rubra TaxID=373956 RepID=A0AAN8WNL7_HALRR